LLIRERAQADRVVARSDRLRVFLSYSRKDKGFTNCLAKSLTERGYEPDFDQSQFDPANIDSGISAEDEWWQRLQQMIAGADVMVFVVSPHSAASKVCDEEIAYARSLGKRIIPVLYRTIEFHKAPPRLAALNIKISFVVEGGGEFEDGLAALCAALEIDVDWYREAKRLTGLAARWDQQARPEDLLLTQADVRAIGDLLEKRPRSAPEISPILVELRDKSRARHDSEARTRRRMQNATIALLLGTIAGLIAWMNQELIKEQWHWYTVDRPYIARNIRPYVLSFEKEKGLQPGQTFKECVSRCPDMVVIPGGTFMMGSENGDPDERPRHQVAIKPFAVSKFEITHDEWQECVALDACVPVEADFGAGRQPVIRVTWTMARDYVKWLKRFTGKEYGLLSESEWEYVARAGSTEVYSFGDDPNQLCKHGNVRDKAGQRFYPHWTTVVECDDGYATTSPVGSYEPNKFGLYDVHGNLWEWVEDCWHDSYDGAPSDGLAWTSGDCSFRVQRGGSWDNGARDVRSANRYRGIPGAWAVTLGFRVARETTALQP
jgi:formylglycine-generating enzyme required for sulfatase activity